MASLDTNRNPSSTGCRTRPGAWALAAVCGLLVALLLASAIEALGDLAAAVHLMA